MNGNVSIGLNRTVDLLRETSQLIVLNISGGLTIFNSTNLLLMTSGLNYTRPPMMFVYFVLQALVPAFAHSVPRLVASSVEILSRQAPLYSRVKFS